MENEEQAKETYDVGDRLLQWKELVDGIADNTINFSEVADDNVLLNLPSASAGGPRHDEWLTEAQKRNLDVRP
jgi:hypothetical protein